MDFLVGKNVSHYRIIARLGAGGMGVVYRAADEELGREVALKVLTDGVLADLSARRRFSREVLAISQLSHPNIARVYDFDTQGDRVFLAMELLSGETLDVRLRRSPMDLEGAIGVGIQLANALGAAHERGVIHRDLKPNNIFLLESDALKVLDFGLSGRSMQGQPPTEGARAPGTVPLDVAAALTEAGQVMGTPGYMSPEQVTAQPQDERTDIFAFGCVLYECLTGRRAFSGTSVNETLSAILFKSPRWEALPPDLPQEIRPLLESCLAKDPVGRPGRMREIRGALQRARGIEPLHDEPMDIPACPNNLPHLETPFVGRDRDLEACTRRLEESRLLTLIGPGGCGKTRLAIRLAETLMNEYPDGVWFLDLASLSDESRVLKSFATILGVHVESDLVLADAIASRLRPQRVLMIIDNCEHLLQASGKLAQLLIASGPQVHCVATTRQPLEIPEERTYPVPSLSMPKAAGDLSADSVAPYESVRLFVERACAASPEFCLSNASAPLVAEVCRRLDGIPLAIELAAAQVKNHTLVEIRSKLDDRFKLLTGGDLDSLPRHRTLLETIQWSDDLLLDVERRLLRTVAIFRGGWTLEAATAVFGDEGRELQVLDLLHRLISKSLVLLERLEGGTFRYQMLESIREYALQHLTGTELELSTRERHCNHFDQLAAEAERGLVSHEQGAWLSRLELDHENILTALEWCARPGGEVERGLQMAGSIWRFWYGRGYFRIGRELLERLLEASEAETPARARALRSAGILAYYQADYVAARTWLTKGLALARSFGDKLNTARGLNGLAGVAMEESKYEEARMLNEESLALSREIGDPGGVGVSLGNLGILAKYQGDQAGAASFSEGALAAFREAGDLGNVATTLFELASILANLGKVDESGQRYAECLSIVAELGEKRMGAYAIEGVGDLSFQLEDALRAVTLLGAAAAIRERIGAPLTPFEMSQREPATHRVRTALSEDAFESGWAAGSRMSTEAALEYARQVLDSMRQSGNVTVPEGELVSSPTESTAILLGRLKEGDERARDRLAERILPVLTRWAHGRLPAALRGTVDTDDIVQATMLRAFRRLHEFETRNEGGLLAFMRKALLNQIRDAVRHAARRPGQNTITEDLIDRGPSPLEQVVDRSTFEAYDAALTQLPEGQRISIILRLEMGYSYQQVAEAVGAPTAGAARMSIARGIQRLARIMEPRGG